MVHLFWDLSRHPTSVPLSYVVLTRLAFVKDFYYREFAHEWLYQICKVLLVSYRSNQLGTQYCMPFSTGEAFLGLILLNLLIVLGERPRKYV